MHTDKLTTKCHLCAYLPAGWLYVQDLGLAIRNCEGAKTLNIRCFVAKTHLSQFTRFYQITNVPFLPV